MSHRITFEQWVPVPLAEVFGFFSDPANLPRIMPPALEARLIGTKIVPPPGAVRSGSRAAGIGSEITVSVRPFPFLPLRSAWIARITEFERDHHFADFQAKGPFRRFAHRHEFEAAARNGRQGTVVRDVVEYEVGFGALGALVEKVFVGPQLRRTFAHRQRTLEQLLASSPRAGGAK